MYTKEMIINAFAEFTEFNRKRVSGEQKCFDTLGKEPPHPPAVLTATRLIDILERAKGEDNV